MKRIPGAILFSVMLFPFTACSRKAVDAGGFDWPQWRGPDRNGTSTESAWNPRALSEGAKVLWIVDLNLGYSNVAVRGTRVYTIGRTREAPIKLAFSCLDAVTGRKIWQSLFEVRGMPQSTPAIDGDRVYGLNGDGTLVCLNAGNGKLVWKKNLQADFHALQPGYEWSTSPIVEGDLLILNGNSRALALDKRDGKLVWAIDDAHQKYTNGDEDAYGSVVVADIRGARCAVFGMPTMLRVVDVRTGSLVASYPHEAEGALCDPIVFEGRVFDPDYSVLLESTGSQTKVLWTSADSFCWPSPVLLGRYLYGINWPYMSYPTSWGYFRADGFAFLCMDWSTGQVVLRKDSSWMTAIFADGKLIALELNGTLHIAEVTPSGYAEISCADVLGGAKKDRIFATPPVLCNGRIYCRNYMGDLVCIDVSR